MEKLNKESNFLGKEKISEMRDRLLFLLNDHINEIPKEIISDGATVRISGLDYSRTETDYKCRVNYLQGVLGAAEITINLIKNSFINEELLDQYKKYSKLVDSWRNNDSNVIKDEAGRTHRLITKELIDESDKMLKALIENLDSILNSKP